MKTVLLPLKTFFANKLVGAAGFEPTTTCSQGRCATRLRYTPIGLTGGTRTHNLQNHNLPKLPIVLQPTPEIITAFELPLEDMAVLSVSSFEPVFTVAIPLKLL